MSARAIRARTYSRLHGRPARRTRSTPPVCYLFDCAARGGRSTCIHTCITRATVTEALSFFSPRFFSFFLFFFFFFFSFFFLFLLHFRFRSVQLSTRGADLAGRADSNHDDVIPFLHFRSVIFRCPGQSRIRFLGLAPPSVFDSATWTFHLRFFTRFPLLPSSLGPLSFSLSLSLAFRVSLLIEDVLHVFAANKQFTLPRTPLAFLSCSGARGSVFGRFLAIGSHMQTFLFFSFFLSLLSLTFSLFLPFFSLFFLFSAHFFSLVLFLLSFPFFFPCSL